MKVTYPAGGWLPPRAHFDLQHPDAGRDFVTDWRGVIQAPGNGQCVKVMADAPFPNGYGPSYPYVRIDTGRFAGHTFYIGHTTSLVSPGQHFGFGHHLSRADQGRNFNGGGGPTNGGWVELGESFGGRHGPNASGHWFDKELKPLTVFIPDPALRYGSHGFRVLEFTHNLVTCGWLNRRFWNFNRTVHGAVVAFQKKHHLPTDGVVDGRTFVTIKHSADLCRRIGRTETQVLSGGLARTILFHGQDRNYS